MSNRQVAVQALLTCKDERFHRLRSLCVETVPGVGGNSVQVGPP